jgi:hypothetical protein
MFEFLFDAIQDNFVVNFFKRQFSSRKINYTILNMINFTTFAGKNKNKIKDLPISFIFPEQLRVMKIFYLT